VIDVKVRIKSETGKVARKVKAANITSLGHAGAYIRGIAKRSIKVSKEPAPPGHQPHTRKGRLKKAIFYGVERERQGVVIGPTASGVGQIGHTHEFGGTEPPKKRKGRKANFRLQVGGHGPIDVEGGKPVVVRLKTDRQVARAQEVAQSLSPSQGGPESKRPRRYPPRPFMGPALEISKTRLPRIWANSVRGG
jgi:hypothetical protein